MSLPPGDRCAVGVDVGTTAVKAVAVDAEGRVVARARVPHRVVAGSVDSLEHDVAQAWRRGPRRALAEVSSRLEGDPAGVVVTSMVPSITAVDRRGTPLLPGLLYGDVRARPDLGADDGGPEDLGGEREQGRRMIEWAVGARPGAHGYWNCQAMATHALAGVPAVDGATATSFGSLCAGGRWDAVALEKLGVSEDQLPVVAGMGEKLGTVPGTSTAFAGGSIDAFCEQIVAGADRPGDVLVIFGATLIVWVVSEEWKVVPGLTTLPNMVAGQVQIGGPSNAGALFADWARSLVAGSSRRSPPASPADADGRSGDPEKVPVWLPYLRGERTPFHDPGLRASLHGLDISQGPEAVVRAAHEASGFVIRRIVDLSGFEARRVVAAGGGSRSLPWMQAVADATGLPVDTAAVPEGAALGAAYLARMAAGLETGFGGCASWSGIGRRIEPDPVWAAAAAERYERFEALGPGR
jgi:sugar (pentulose or hexulose) kinase